MSYAAYPAHITTRWPEVGSVPSGWEVRRLKFSVSLRNEKVEAEDANLEYMGLEHIESWTGRRIEDESASSEGIAARFVEGDVLFGKLRPYLAKVYLAEKEGMATTEALVLVSASVLAPSFLKHLLLSDKFINAVSGSTYGAKMPRANWEFIGGLSVLLPALAEQQQIAAFLDWKTGQIDALIGKKQELLEKLEEKRIAVITQAVTQGLNPARLKSSGLPWCGDIPHHWHTRRLRDISDFITVGVVVNPSTYFSEEGVPFLLGGDVREMKIDIENSKRCSAESSRGPLVKSRLQNGDIVVVRVGYPGVAAVVPPEIAGGNVASMMLVRNHPRYCSDWLAYAFNSQVGRDQVEIVQYGAAQKQFNISHAVDFAYPFPPLSEQRAIATYLKDQTEKISQLVEFTQTAIARLTEYRTALITAATTGKIDVRGVTIPCANAR